MYPRTNYEMTQPDLEKLSIELNEDTRFILGQPCFTLINYAQRLRQLGHEIKPRAEDEQATVICWMLNLYLQHGPAWREEGRKILLGAEAPAPLQSIAESGHGARALCPANSDYPTSR